MSSAVLRTAVLVRGDDHKVVVLPAGSTVPDEYIDHITNPAAFEPAGPTPAEQQAEALAAAQAAAEAEAAAAADAEAKAKAKADKKTVAPEANVETAPTK